MPPARDLLRHAFAVAVAAADPEAAVAAALTQHPPDLRGVGRVWVVGAGKATAPMAVAVEAALGERIAGGLIVVKHGHGLPLRRITVREAAHPVPDQAGLAATAELMDLLRSAAAEDLVIALISGGASALLPAPRAGLDFADEQAVHRALLASGAPIHEMNAVRKHCSAIKGGQLARLAAPARLVAYILSDVIGDDLSVIASGPTVPDPSTFAQATEYLRARRIVVPERVRELFVRGCAGDEVETPKQEDPCFSRVENHLVGSNARSLAAIESWARGQGLAVERIADPVMGEVSQAAEAFCRRLVTLAAGMTTPTLLLAGGEPTVTLSANPGLGGRAQAFAVAAGLRLHGHAGVQVLAAGTDGSDGPTDAAGAFADGTSLMRAQATGIDLAAHAARHDAHPALAALGDLLITGPTRTNVMDVYLGLIA